MKHGLALAMILAAGSLLAQNGPTCNMKNMPKYDASTVQTITGNIASVDRQNHGTHTGIFLKLTTGLTVHVGPEAFLSEKGFQLAQGDTVTVTGSMKRMRGSDTLLASQLQNGSNVLRLRDESGKPLWAATYCNR